MDKECLILFRSPAATRLILPLPENGGSPRQ